MLSHSGKLSFITSAASCENFSRRGAPFDSAEHAVGHDPVFLAIGSAVWEIIGRMAVGPRVRFEQQLRLSPLLLAPHDAQVGRVSPQQPVVTGAGVQVLAWQPVTLGREVLALS